MSSHRTLSLSIGVSAALLLGSCGTNDAPESSTPATDSTDVQNDQVMSLGGRLFSVPSPIASALAVRDAGLAYQRDALLALDAGASLTGRTEQALAMGMYGADLAYATAHQDGQRTLATLQSIERLSASLELSNAFDKALLERFKKNLSNEDSLLRFSGAAFRAADEYLKTNEREDVSTLILAGGWLESLHLSLSDPKAATSKAIVARVGEQGHTLQGLIELLDGSSDERTKKLHAGLVDLQTEFKDIEIKYTFEAPVTDRESKTTFINSTSTVTMGAGKLNAIATKVAALRSSLLA